VNRFVAGAIIVVSLMTVERARASDMALKALTAPTMYDWTGLYVGGHLGYAAGTSNWSATQGLSGAPNLTGSFGLFNAYDAFEGTGSYILGLQTGFNYMLPSRLVIGLEADVSLPNTLSGGQTISSGLIGQAQYQDQVEFSGTVRGRIGYAPGNWLFYATGGFAYSYDQLTRTQTAGTPVAGTAQPGETETLFMEPRVGGAAGGGVEVALTPNWMARLEYLYTGYASRGVNFPIGAQRFDSDLTIQSLRIGLDYKLGRDGIDPDLFANGPSALDLGWFAVHAQTTFIEQYAAPFHAPYHGRNSLDSNAGRESGDMMAFVGVRLWQGAEFWVDPELGQGFGLSNTEGVAGYPNGTAFKIGSSVPYGRIQRYFVRQTIDLGGATSKVEADQNVFAGSQTADRLVITLGKFSVSDIFDSNKYAQNPRKDFLNWALIDTGSFDYAADAWGYTYGAAAEWYQGNWTLRGGLFNLSAVPNSTGLDPTFEQFQWIGEIERRWDIWSHPGKIAITGFLSRGRMGAYGDAIALAEETGEPADISAVRRYRSRGGIGLNIEQEVTSDLGVFARAGMANGNVESYDYTDIDRTVAAGLALTGKRWGRPDDVFGLAGIINGISSIQQTFLNDGGLGILVGDGQLPNPGLEKIIESYYDLRVFGWNVTFDYQFIVNPAYNRDRGPVSVISTRLHAEF
jgi:high affinity Mn2+ porin